MPSRHSTRREREEEVFKRGYAPLNSSYVTVPLLLPSFFTLILLSLKKWGKGYFSKRGCTPLRLPLFILSLRGPDYIGAMAISSFHPIPEIATSLSHSGRTPRDDG